MTYYLNKDKQYLKKLILEKISDKIDEAIENLEISYDYHPFSQEVWIDSFNGEFKLHFTAANELNGGKDYLLKFDYFGRQK